MLLRFFLILAFIFASVTTADAKPKFQPMGGPGMGKHAANQHGHGKPKRVHGNNGLGNGLDPQPPGNPPVNDGPGAFPGNPGNKQGRR
jgi:hypothetical protein